MNLATFFHIWMQGGWREPTEAFTQTLIESGFAGPIHLNPVSDGWEQATIERVRAYSQDHDGAVLYAHAKGSADPTAFNARWRQSMTRQVVAKWAENLAALEEYDLVGCHWITPAMVPPGAGSEFADGLAFFGGNFWMARCDYLRTLPACPTGNRHQAERWIGMGTPRVLDLLPGWPDDSLWPELCE